MAKTIIKLTESDLNEIIIESVNRVLNEYSSQYMDTFEAPEDDDYVKTDEFKKEFYDNIRKCLREMEYLFLVEYINGASYTNISQKYGRSRDFVRKTIMLAIAKLRGNKRFKNKIEALLNGDVNADGKHYNWQEKMLSKDPEYINLMNHRQRHFARQYAMDNYGVSSI